MFNRKQLCTLAGLDLEAFKHALKNNDLPFIVSDSPAEKAGGSDVGSYSRYCHEDVLALACTAQLAAGGGYLPKGLPFNAAAKIVKNAGPWKLSQAVLRANRSKEVVYVGYMVLKGPSGEAGSNLFGNWNEVGGQLSLTAEGNELVELFLLPPANIEQNIRARATENDIIWQPSWIE